jgi:hypothetical protein
MKTLRVSAMTHYFAVATDVVDLCGAERHVFRVNQFRL